MTMKLHCFGESGNSYKAALTMEMAGADWEPVFVDFFKGANKAPEYLALNPLGEVPVMQDGDLTLFQSGAIQDYVIEKTGKLGGANATERREILTWILFDNHRLSSQTGLTRFLMNFLPEDKRPKEAIAFMQGGLKGTYKKLTAGLKGKDWLVGDSITAADIACVGYLYYPEPFGFVRAEHPEIDAWMSRISEQPGWKHPYDLMPGGPK